MTSIVLSLLAEANSLDWFTFGMLHNIRRQTAVVRETFNLNSGPKRCAFSPLRFGRYGIGWPAHQWGFYSQVKGNRTKKLRTGVTLYYLLWLKPNYLRRMHSNRMRTDLSWKHTPRLWRQTPPPPLQRVNSLKGRTPVDRQMFLKTLPSLAVGNNYY